MTSILLVIKISWIWRDFKLYFVILNFLDRTTRKGGKSEYLLLGPSYMVFILGEVRKLLANNRGRTSAAISPAGGLQILADFAAGTTFNKPWFSH